MQNIKSKSSLKDIFHNIDDILPSKEDFMDKINKSITGGNIIIKLGFDPTAPDLHIGHLIAIRKVRQLLYYNDNIKAVIIIGGITASIGDPSGKNGERPILSRKQIDKNIGLIEEQVMRYLPRDRTEIINNIRWYRAKDLNFEEFLKSLQMLNLSEMLQRSEMKKRIKNEGNIRVDELIYPVLQGYDSYKINADVEIGGSDQLFNMHVGRKMQKKNEQDPQAIMTLKIINGTCGLEKMSKSLNNTINLNDSVMQVYNKLLRLNDDIVEEYLEYLSIFNNEFDVDKDLSKKELKLQNILNLMSIIYNKHPQEIEQQINMNKTPTLAVAMDKDEIISKKHLMQWLKLGGICSSVKVAKGFIQPGNYSINGNKIRDIKDQAKLYELFLNITKEGSFTIKAGRRGELKIKIKR